MSYIVILGKLIKTRVTDKIASNTVLFVVCGGTGAILNILHYGWVLIGVLIRHRAGWGFHLPSHSLLWLRVVLRRATVHGVKIGQHVAVVPNTRRLKHRPKMCQSRPKHPRYFQWL